MKMKNTIILILFVLIAVSCKKKTEENDSTIYYTCSMDPQVMEKKPGNCPICKMELTKTIISSDNNNSLKLSEDQIKLAGIRVQEIRRGSAGEGITLRGTVTEDKRKVNVISSRVPGRIERLYFKNEGEKINPGDRIYDIYSEALQASIQQYILLKEKAKNIKGGNVNYDEMAKAAKDKLIIWGLSENQIRNLTASNSNTLPFYSKETGIVKTVEVNEGDYVNEGSPVLTIADYSTLWVEAEAYPEDMKIIKPGLKVNVVVEAFSHEIIEGKVSFEDPELEPQSKINLVRIEIQNKDKKYKPGMRATISISTKESESIVVPASAVLSQPSMNVVWVMTGNGSFIPKMVETGMESNGIVEIKSGLKEGDHVVISGVYLLNSEYLLRKGTNSMDDMPGMNHDSKKSAGHRH